MNQDQDPTDILKQLLSNLFQGNINFSYREDSMGNFKDPAHYFDYKKELDFDTKKHLLYQLVSTYEKMLNQDVLLEKEFGINLHAYNENFYKIIDALFLIAFNKNIAQLLYFYFYERQNPDGTLNKLVFEEDNGTEYERLIESVKDLFSVMLKLNPNLFKNG